MRNTLKIFGHPASQPSRAVFWSCLLHDLPFELPEAPSLQSDEANPRGQLPYIIDGGFFLAEMPAIVCYLADRHGWSNLYPYSLKTRARLHMYLHMHHSLVRLATLKLMVPFVLKPLGALPEQQNPLSMLHRDMMTIAFASEDALEEGRRVVGRIAGFLESVYFDDEFPFVCNTASASIADLAAYAELAQLEFAGLFGFRDYPRLSRWLTAMRALPWHDTIHTYNTELGDIVTRPNNADRFARACAKSIQALRETGLVS